MKDEQVISTQAADLAARSMLHSDTDISDSPVIDLEPIDLTALCG
jgi:hypothetical protein